MFWMATVCCVIPSAYRIVPGRLSANVSAISWTCFAGTPEICSAISGV
jgi:hypothetical protein